MRFVGIILFNLIEIPETALEIILAIPLIGYMKNRQVFDFLSELILFPHQRLINLFELTMRMIILFVEFLQYEVI